MLFPLLFEAQINAFSAEFILLFIILLSTFTFTLLFNFHFRFIFILFIMAVYFIETIFYFYQT